MSSTATSAHRAPGKPSKRSNWLPVSLAFFHLCCTLRKSWSFLGLDWHTEVKQGYSLVLSSCCLSPGTVQHSTPTVGKKKPNTTAILELPQVYLRLKCHHHPRLEVTLCPPQCVWWADSCRSKWIQFFWWQVKALRRSRQGLSSGHFMQHKG